MRNTVSNKILERFVLANRADKDQTAAIPPASYGCVISTLKPTSSKFPFMLNSAKHEI